MKKLIGMLAILMIAINVMGQAENSLFCDYFQYENSSYLKYTANSIAKMGTYHARYSFVSNGKVYIITYDSLSINTMRMGKIERKLFVYRLDGTRWVIASNVIQTDRVNFTDKGYNEYDTYVPLNYYGDKDSSTVGKVTPKNGGFEIKLMCHTYTKKNVKNNLSDFYCVTLSLKPEKNDIFTFEISTIDKKHIKYVAAKL